MFKNYLFIVEKILLTKLALCYWTQQKLPKHVFKIYIDLFNFFKASSTIQKNVVERNK